MSLPSRSGPLRHTPVVGVLLTLALIGLVVLQWRWLGDLSRAHGRERRRTMQASVEQIAARARAAVGEVARGVQMARLGGEDPGGLPFVARVVPLEDGGGPAAPEPHGFVVHHLDGARSLVVLDPERVVRELFPRAARDVLGPEDRLAYDLSVSYDDGAVTSFGAQEPGAPAEASAELRLVPDQWIELSTEGDGWMAEGQPVFVGDGVLDGAGDGLLQHGTATWRIELRLSEGPLDEVLTATRVRNALLGGGVLAVLVAGLAFLWVAEQRARQLAERQLAFVAGVSHELRTPLAVARTAASNLARGVVVEGDDVASYGELIEREVERLDGLVERALRSSAGAPPLSLVDVDLAEALATAVERCEIWRDRRRFDVVVDVPDECRSVRADGSALTTALHVLVENAVKYGPNGQAVRVSARRTAHGVTVEVADEGPGVPADERARIFGAFERGEGARSGGIPGAGLGLSVAREVAEAHGGALELVDAGARAGERAGATFRLSIPDEARDRGAAP